MDVCDSTIGSLNFKENIIRNEQKAWRNLWILPFVLFLKFIGLNDQIFNFLSNFFPFFAWFSFG